MEPTDLAFAGLVRQAGLVRDGSVSPRELVELSLERIARLDPELNAFRVVLAEQARAEAAAAERDDGVADQPLRGVPVAVKDDLDVAGEVTAFGTGAYGPPAREDSEVVRRLRAAGAIVIGKTNVPELTQWPFTESITWGRTRNPWDLERTPGGSSGGSAAAVAAGLVPAALGTDGLGSVRIPAACCGLVGVKPQRGRVSYAPLAEHWHGLSVIGPLVRRAADAALLLDVMAAERPARGFVEAAHPPSARCGSRSPPRPRCPVRSLARFAPPSRRPPPCSAHSAIASRSATPPTERRSSTRPRATCAGSTTTRPRCRGPTASSAAPGRCRGPAASFPRGSWAGCARPSRPSPRSSAPCSASSTCS